MGCVLEYANIWRRSGRESDAAWPLHEKREIIITSTTAVKDPVCGLDVETASNMNSEEPRAHWNLKFERGVTSLTQPDPFFISAYQRSADHFFPNADVALDLACGLGRHALWLASRSWQVSAVPTNNSSHAKEDVGDSPFRSFPHGSQRAFDFRWSYW
jgi:hypothetical protein